MLNNNHNNNNYVDISFFSLRRLWAQFAMRGWSRSGFLLQMQIKSFDFCAFLAQSIPWRKYFFQVSVRRLKLKADFLQKLFPEGNGFQMEIQIQTRLMNAIWGPKSENSARVPIACSPGGARGPRRGPIAFSRGQAGQKLHCDYTIPGGLPIHRGSTVGLLNCSTAFGAWGSAASAACAASSRGLEHYVKATAIGDRQ